MTKNELTRLEEQGLSVRAMPVKQRETGELDVVASTDAPAKVWDWERFDIVDEVLRMDGYAVRAGDSVPFLDSHQRGSVDDVLGTFGDMKVVGGNLEGTVKFSSDEKAQRALNKYREGHLTDVSVGYRVLESVWVDEGTKATIKGVTYEGPLKVSTKWMLQELSAVPIGADPQAVAKSVREFKMVRNLCQERQETEMDEKEMREKVRAELAQEMEAKRAEEARIQKLKDEEARKLAEVAAKAVAEDRVRASEIRAIAQKAGVDGEKLIADGLTVEEARAKILDSVLAQKGANPAPAASVEMGLDQSDKLRDAAIEGLLIRAGQIANDKTTDAGRELAGFSLVELAREALRVKGQPHRGSSMEVVKRALTTSDLPIILGNTANKSLLGAFQAAPQTWREWAGIGRLEDFKQATITKLGESEDLQEVKEHGEFKHSTMAEDKEVVQMSTYGRIFSLSRQAIINDDLNAFTRLPAEHGEAAARKIGDVAYAVLTANAVMNDGVALFDSAAHGNVGTPGAPSVTTIGEAVKLMKLQTNLGGDQRLYIMPRYFIGPVGIEAATEQFFRSSLEGTAALPNLINPFAGEFLRRVYDPRLDAADVDAWYVLGQQGKTVTVYFLQGNEAPVMETRQGFEIDGIEWKVRLDVAAKAVDHRGMVYNAG